MWRSCAVSSALWIGTETRSGVRPLISARRSNGTVVLDLYDSYAASSVYPDSQRRYTRIFATQRSGFRCAKGQLAMAARGNEGAVVSVGVRRIEPRTNPVEWWREDVALGWSLNDPVELRLNAPPSIVTVYLAEDPLDGLDTRTPRSLVLHVEVPKRQGKNGKGVPKRLEVSGWLECDRVPMSARGAADCVVEGV